MRGVYGSDFLPEEREDEMGGERHGEPASVAGDDGRPAVSVVDSQRPDWVTDSQLDLRARRA